MIKASDISVIVITKDRIDDLKRLLLSLGQLYEFPKEVLIVTSSRDIAIEKDVTDELKLVNTRLVFQPPLGYSAARNLGIKNSVGKVVVFVDDDCVVPPNWITEIVAAHNRLGSMSVIMGKALSVPLNNFYSAVAQMHYDNWVNSICSSGKCVTLDAKITSFDKNIFIKDNLWFSDMFSGGSEDVELGYRLHQCFIKIYYEPKIYFYHTERIRFMEVINQRWRRGRGEALLHLLPLSRSLRLPGSVIKQFAVWVKEGKGLWCLKYMLLIPVFLFIRVGSYWQGIFDYRLSNE